MKRFPFFILMVLLFGLQSAGLFAEPAAAPAAVSHRYMKSAELHRRLEKGERFVILDARSTFAYNNEHIKDALSLPLSDIKLKIGGMGLSKDAAIVTYCSCPHHIAEMASDVLKDLGYRNLYVLDDGIPGWKKRGYALSGELANKPLTIFWMIGFVTGPFGKPLADVDVRAYQPQTEQLEIDKTGKDGFYAMPLRFYGLKPGDQLQAAVGRDTIFFTAGKRKNPWGTRIDDEESHLSFRDNAFAKTFKSRKLHP